MEYTGTLDYKVQAEAEKSLFNAIYEANDINLNEAGFGEFFRHKNRSASLLGLSVRVVSQEEQHTDNEQVVVRATMVGDDEADVYFEDIAVANINSDGLDYSPIQGGKVSFAQFAIAAGMAEGLKEDKEMGILSLLSDDLSHISKQSKSQTN